MKSFIFLLPLLVPFAVVAEVAVGPTADAADSGVFRRTYRVRAGRVNPLWNLVMVTRRGVDISVESVSVERVEHGFRVRLL